MPQVKILKSPTNGQVSVAFRQSGKNYKWIPVDNVPINVDELESHAKAHGFDHDLHSTPIIKADQTSWQKEIKHGPEEREGVPYPIFHGKKKGFSPGHQWKKEIMSSQFNSDYSSSEKFRTTVENMIKTGVNKAMSMIGLTLDKNSDNYEELVALTREHLITSAGKIEEEPFTPEWEKGMRSVIASGARTAVSKYTKDKNMARGDTGDGDTGGGRAGGREEIADFGGGRSGTGGAGNDVNLRQGASAGGTANATVNTSRVNHSIEPDDDSDVEKSDFERLSDQPELTTGGSRSYSRHNNDDDEEEFEFGRRNAPTSISAPPKIHDDDEEEDYLTKYAPKPQEAPAAPKKDFKAWLAARKAGNVLK